MSWLKAFLRLREENKKKKKHTSLHFFFSGDKRNVAYLHFTIIFAFWIFLFIKEYKIIPGESELYSLIFIFK